MHSKTLRSKTCTKTQMGRQKAASHKSGIPNPVCVGVQCSTLATRSDKCCRTRTWLIIITISIILTRQHKWKSRRMLKYRPKRTTLEPALALVIFHVPENANGILKHMKWHRAKMKHGVTQLRLLTRGQRRTKYSPTLAASNWNNITNLSDLELVFVSNTLYDKLFVAQREKRY